MSHLSLIKHVKSAGFIVPSKEIKVAVFHQKNTKTIIKEALRTKKSWGIATDEKQLMAMTNMNVCYSIKTPQSTSDNPSSLDHIKASGVPISTRCIWKSECRKKMTTRRWRWIVGISQETEKFKSDDWINWASEWIYWKSSKSGELTNLQWHIVGPWSRATREENQGF